MSYRMLVRASLLCLVLTQAGCKLSCGTKQHNDAVAPVANTSTSPLPTAVRAPATDEERRMVKSYERVRDNREAVTSSLMKCYFQWVDEDLLAWIEKDEASRRQLFNPHELMAVQIGVAQSYGVFLSQTLRKGGYGGGALGFSIACGGNDPNVIDLSRAQSLSKPADIAAAIRKARAILDQLHADIPEDFATEEELRRFEK